MEAVCLTRELQTGARGESGQASFLLLGLAAALLTGLVVLFAFGQALGAKGRHQRAADLAAVSAAQVMRDHYPRLFEPPVLWDGAPNPRHLPQAAFLALARAAAGRGARRNGVPADRIAVSFPGAGFGPTRVTVGVRGRPELPIPGRRRSARVPVRARATAELALDAAGFERAAYASGGGYSGPLAYRTGKPMRHLFRVAEPRCGRGWTGLGEEQLCAEAPPLRLAALPVSRAAAPDAGASGIR